MTDYDETPYSSVLGNSIFFTGDVSSYSIALLKEDLYALVSEGWPWINIFIQSSGGNSFSAYSLYDHLKALKSPIINTIADGETSSAASIIFLGGKNRFITKSSVFRPHERRFSYAGQRYDQAVDIGYNFVRDEQRARGIYVDELLEVWNRRKKNRSFHTSSNKEVIECNSPKECIEQIVPTEIDYNAEEVIEMGFADALWTAELQNELMLF